MIGRRIEHYEVHERLGAGGMGEVWRASDSKLGRDVALKVLPPQLATDPERMTRFQREAQVLAALNHSNIGAIYGLEESDGVRCLVLELVRGETLSERIARGALPLDEALTIARQMSHAIEAAHEQGILHRDLKPGNVMITPDGTVKVLDFGLAKAFDADPATPELSASPTLSLAATMAGVILGTAAYMSPEQAKGKRVDRRADIWAFGVVLFEMLTGQQAFEGETASEVLAAVMMREIEWAKLPADLPTPILRLLRRCLDKDPKRRLRDIGEARLVIEDYLANPDAWRAAAGSTAAPAANGRTPRLAWGIAVAFGVAAILTAWAPWRAPASRPAVMDLDVELAEEPLFSGYGAAAVISAQGDRVAFVTGGEVRGLHVRDLANATPRMIAGTDLAYHQFFSPAGDWIGFFTRTELKKVSVRGGAPITLAPVNLNRGGTWGQDGTIVYAPNPSGALMRVSAAGGEPRALTQLDSLKGESSHRWPSWIPGKDAVLFTVFTSTSGMEAGNIELVQVKSGKRRLLHHGGTQPRYISTGHILYMHEGTLYALPFDAGRLEVTGTPSPLAENVMHSRSEGGAQFDVAANGTLVTMYGTAIGDSTELIRYRFAGGPSEVLMGGGGISGLAVSPEGRRVAFTLGVGPLSDVWMLDLERRTQTRMTFGDGRSDFNPVWSPDGKSLAYSSNENGGAVPVIHVKAADGSGEPRKVSNARNVQAPGAWSPDGSTIVFFEFAGGSWDIGSMRLDAPDAQTMILSSPAVELSPRLSPDGRWLAYHSTESGRPEVYVRPFPGPGGKWQLSTEGGAEPRWSRKGTELFYRRADRLYSVPITLGRDAAEIGQPRERLVLTGEPVGTWGTYDLLPDGSGVVAARDVQRDRDLAPLRRVRMTFNWFERVRELTAPQKR
ncbi:MAG: protein kinase [Candidatus Eisenbacteria bacterium]